MVVVEVVIGVVVVVVLVVVVVVEGRVCGLVGYCVVGLVVCCVVDIVVGLVGCVVDTVDDDCSSQEPISNYNKSLFIRIIYSNYNKLKCLHLFTLSH